MSKTTAKLLPLALEDSYRVLKDVAKRQNHPSLYNEGDVTQTIKLVHGCNYEETIQICPNIKATFFRNGHLMGATSILVQIASDGYEDINLFLRETIITRICFLMFLSCQNGLWSCP